MIKYQRKIIEVEKRLGFLYVPAVGQEFMPKVNGKFKVLLQGEKQASSLSYNADYKRIFGLTKWYSKNKIAVGSVLKIELSKSEMQISLSSSSALIVEEEEKENDVIDLTGLSSSAKGNIVEDRIKELILLYGQGLLNVYKPVVDNRGIDLIVMMNGVFMPIFLQVKSRFNAVKQGFILIDVSESTFSVHHSFYIIGAAFNPATLELEDKILLISSKEYEENSRTITVRGKNKKRIAVSLKENTKAKGAKYFVKKAELVEKLIEKFDEMSKYYR